MNGVQGVDGKGIGRDAYFTFTEEEQALVAFGMFPNDKMEYLERAIRERIAEIIAEKWGCPEAKQDLAKAIYKHVMAEIMKDVCVGLMESAKSVGKMIA